MAKYIGIMKFVEIVFTITIQVVKFWDLLLIRVVTMYSNYNMVLFVKDLNLF